MRASRTVDTCHVTTPAIKKKRLAMLVCETVFGRRFLGNSGKKRSDSEGGTATRIGRQRSWAMHGYCRSHLSGCMGLLKNPVSKFNFAAAETPAASGTCSGSWN